MADAEKALKGARKIGDCPYFQLPPSPLIEYMKEIVEPGPPPMLDDFFVFGHKEELKNWRCPRDCFAGAPPGTINEIFPAPSMVSPDTVSPQQGAGALP